MNYSSHFQKKFYYSMPYFIKNLIATVYGWQLAKKRTGGGFKKHLKELLELQYWPLEKIKDLQFQRCKNLLLYSKIHCRYYRKLFEAYGFEPEKMQDLSDISVLPVLQKNELRENMEDIISDEAENMQVIWSHTSGTTGLGLRFPESLDSLQREFAFRVHSYSLGGVQWRNKWAWCAGHPVTFYDRKKPPFWVHDMANNWLLMSSYHLSEKNLPFYIEKLEAFGPELIAGYPSSLFLLAIANSKMGKKVRTRAAVTSSETLFENQRKIIQDSFGCKVFDYYGNAERAALITECEKGRRHLRLEYSYVEFLNNENMPVSPGEEGRLVCTAFGNYAMPLIRYDIGDIAILSKEKSCECGRSGILIDRIMGRIEDYVVTPDGRYVGRLDHLFKDSVNVRLAQIVQKDRKSILIRVVREPNYSIEDEKVILKEARVRLGSEIAINFEYVEDIPKTKGGKLRFVISMLNEAKPEQKFKFVK